MKSTTFKKRMTDLFPVVPSNCDHLDMLKWTRPQLL
jgi:hypothetical protein